MILAKRSVGTAATALVLAIAGCGTPGPPQPPSLNLPDRVDNLTAVRTGTRSGSRGPCPSATPTSCRSSPMSPSRYVAAKAQTPVPPLRPSVSLLGRPRRMPTRLPGVLASGSPRALSYFIELENRNGRSAGASNVAVVLAGDAPGPVVGFAAEVRKSGVVLRWSPGDSQASIRIHRKLLTPHAAPAHAGPLAPPPEPVDETLLVEKDTGKALDPGIIFGNSYQYRAQRVARIAVDGRTLELAGEISPPIRMDALDVFPPEAPTGLAAVATAGVPPSVDLNWEPNTEQDLAGYMVYRRESETPWRRISGETLVAGPAFHDGDVQPGHTYRYGVSAVDRGGHESGRSAEAQETVPAP